MKTKAMKQNTLRLLVILLAVIMIFSALSVTLSTLSAEDGVFRRNDSIYSEYKSFLDGSVVQKLPSTVKDDDLISVIIRLDQPTLMDAYNKTEKKMSFGAFAKTEEADSLRAAIAADKAAYLAALSENGVDYTVGADYANLISGFEVLFRAKHFSVATAQLGTGCGLIVGESYQVAETKLVENKVSVYEETGIFDSSDFRYDGSGMVVAVLDTGLDYTHPAFSMANFHPTAGLGLTKAEVAGCISNTAAALRVPGLTADDVYISDKVPFSFDYADNDADVYSMHNNHGTHVSGVIVGKDDVITGVAPNAQLVSMKIFSDTLESARASWILSALEDCVELGVDVINMSLGTACGFSREIDKMQMEAVYDEIRELGISLVVAASNSYSSAHGSEKNGNLGLTSNPDTGTVGSPSTYPAALSIASIDGTKTPYILDAEGKIIYFLEGTDSAGEEKIFFDDLLGSSQETLSLEYVLIPGVGNPTDYKGIDVTGKIALVRRGDNTFEEKAKAAAAAGARALIVFNNTSGDIRMNVGIVDIPVCSISQDDGEKLAAQKTGLLKVAHSQASGPFMSDFSSWGPTPSLEIKPEITAHGGNILSAVTGHGYDRLSGTSMACPNMSGVVALMRQYVINEMPASMTHNAQGQIDYVAVNAIVNRLLMSTADVIYNKNGLPYAVRKQGAGLANLAEASATQAYILTYCTAHTDVDEDGLCDKCKNQNTLDKTKVELGHDPSKSGVYTFRFSIVNFGATALSYDLSATVMTEGVSDTPTYSGETVVTAEGYILSGAAFEILSVSGGQASGNTVTVGANAQCDVEVKITLSESDKQYLNDSFENGMYVEGFVSLAAKDEGSTDLGIPYLGFYGNWYAAPLFDLDYFETNADELNDAIATLDKTLPDAYATRPVGGIEDDYISYLGSYYFRQNPQNKIISAKREYVAISNTAGTVHSLRFVWGGQLRNASKILITITDDATGEVVFSKEEVSVRKSYGDGGSYIYPTNIEIEFDAAERGLKNNASYTVKLVGYLEYGDGGIADNERNTFEFPLKIDYEAPALTGCDFYTEYDSQARKTRLFAKLAVYDNHYAMAMQVGYVGAGTVDGVATNILYPFDQYITPIYSVENGTTYVTYELTDHIFDIKKDPNQPGTGSYHDNTFAVTLYDYAMNDATYEIELPDDFLDFYLEETDITLNSYETYTLSANVYPEREWDELLTFSSSNTDVVRVVNNKLVAMPVSDQDIANGNNTALIFIADEKTGKYATMNVTVVNDGWVTKPVADVFKLTGYDTLYAFYIMSNEDRDIGETGDTTIFENEYYQISLYPNEKVQLKYQLDAYFPEDTKLEFLSGDGDGSIIKVDQTGKITAVGEGYTSVTVRASHDEGWLDLTVDIEVKDPYVRTGPTLNNYYGAGSLNSGRVDIPADMLFTQIGQYAFSNYNYVPKDLSAGDVISEEEPENTKIAYIGNDFITEVIIPEGVKSIGPYAFAGLTELKRVVLPSTLESIEYGAFFGCTKLTEVVGLEHVQLINKYAFQNCDIQNPIIFNNIHAIGDFAFAGNVNLESISLPRTVSSIGAYAFMGNLSLKQVDVSRSGNIKYGPYVFLDCESLEEITINSSVIPTGAFYGCENLTTLHIGRDVSTIGEYALSGTKISSFSVVEGNTTYYPVADKNYLLSADGTTLLMVAPQAGGTFALPGVTRVGYGAFAGNRNIKAVVMPQVTYVDDYAFSECTALTSVSFAPLSNIGKYAFLLTNLSELPEFDSTSLRALGEYAFAFTLIREVNVPNGMQVGAYAFAECKELQTVKIGDSVTLGDGAFMRAATREDPRKEPGTFMNYTVSPITVVENGKTLTFYRFEFVSALENLQIGQNVKIGVAAFAGAAGLEQVTIGAGAEIGEMAFYNCSSLQTMDLSGVTHIGKMAFSGDVQYLYTNPDCTDMAVQGDLYRVYYYANQMTEVDLSSLVADGLGEQAFTYCRELTDVHLGKDLANVPYMAFAGCEKLATVNLGSVKTVGEAAFTDTALTAADLGAATYVGPDAFSGCQALTTLTLSATAEEITLDDGAFYECTALRTVENLGRVTKLGAYAFAYTDLRGADLSSAVEVGDHAFIKGEMTGYVFALTLGDKIEQLGDNPFAMCRLAPLYRVEDILFNEKKVGERVLYNYAINEYIQVVNGSLYTKVPYGLELTTYIGLDRDGKSLDRTNVQLSDQTVRVSAMAFAGSDIVRVTLPHSLNAIGHKAFYACEKLTTVTFKSYTAPILEEEFDEAYYLSFDNLPCTGDYEITVPVDKNGNGILESGDQETQVHAGLAIVPYYMWNLSNTKYNNVYYGATFVDYIGHTGASNREYANMGQLVMVAPSNGVGYDSFILAQYFADTVAGDVAADDITMAAIAAIDRLPGTITLKDADAVAAARAAYDSISSALQQTLVKNYDKLRRAEMLIEAFLNNQTPTEPPAEPMPEQPGVDGGRIALIVVVIIESVMIGGAGIAALVYFILKKKKTKGQQP